MSRCETCRSGGECEEWCGQSVSEIWEEKETLQSKVEQLEKLAREMLSVISQWEYGCHTDDQESSNLQEKLEQILKGEA